MSDLFEVVFEGLDDQGLQRILDGMPGDVALTVTGSIDGVDQNGTPLPLAGVPGLKGALDGVLTTDTFPGPSGLGELGCVARAWQLRLLRCGSTWRVEFNFEAADVPSRQWSGFVEQLHRWAARLWRETEAETVYAGLEPAEDRDTRLFTELAPGPLAGHVEFPSGSGS